jgi:hypothetical protein
MASVDREQPGMRTAFANNLFRCKIQRVGFLQSDARAITAECLQMGFNNVFISFSGGIGIRLLWLEQVVPDRFLLPACTKMQQNQQLPVMDSNFTTRPGTVQRFLDFGHFRN